MMSKKRRKDKVIGRYFTWLLGQRNGVYFADGRSNSQCLGRHSLGTRDRQEAERNLAQLDELMGSNRGLMATAPAHRLTEESDSRPGCDSKAVRGNLSFEDGRRRYEDHISGSQIVGGVRKKTMQRYRAVMDKFIRFSIGRGLENWNQTDAQLLRDYATGLEQKKYGPRTISFELTTIKQIIGWLIRSEFLPESCRVTLRITKFESSDTYSWKPAEIKAMFEHCRATPNLQWLGNVLVALTFTGMRIGEVRELRWSDVSLDTRRIRLTDETACARKDDANRRTLKGKRGRAFPIHPELFDLLNSLDRKSDGFVFHGPRDGRLKPDTVRTAFIRDVLKPLAPYFPSGNGAKGFTHGRLHSFRHAFASMCANNNVPILMAMEWLGHRQSSMLQYYYTLNDEVAQKQMNQLQVFEGAGDQGAVS